MPIYEYQCGGCGLQIAEFRAIRERDKPGVCENCGGVESFNRLLSAPHVWSPTRTGQ